MLATKNDNGMKNPGAIGTIANRYTMNANVLIQYHLLRF